MICSGNMSLIARSCGNTDLRPLSFAVDDVTPSTQVLDTCDCLGAMQANLARRILASPVDGRQIVESMTDCSNPLVEAIHLAFSQHLPLTLTPDAIWLTIVQGFSH